MDAWTEEGGVDGARGGLAFASVPLLPREREVLQLTASGFPTPAVAFVLGISCGAVEELLRRCVWRLRATDVNDAIAEARWREFIPY